MKSPVVSVCVLAHNSARWIRHALDSVLNQTFQNWECLVSDDASSDGTCDAVKPFLTDSRIRYIHHPTNLGQAGNWSYAIKSTSATYIATLHADDVWHPDALAVFMDAFHTDKQCDLVVGQWERVDSNLARMAHQPPVRTHQTLSSEAALSYLLRTNAALPSATAFSRKAANAAGSPFQQYGMLCDRDYLLRLAKASQHIAIQSHSIVQYRVHTDSVTTEFTNNGKLLRELAHFDLRVAALVGTHPQRQQLLHEYYREIAAFYFESAIGLRVAGNREEADLNIKRALSHNLALLSQPKRLAKWILFKSGEPGRLLLSRLHGRNRYVTSLE